jgi:hypothetical protein
MGVGDGEKSRFAVTDEAEVKDVEKDRALAVRVGQNSSVSAGANAPTADGDPPCTGRDGDVKHQVEQAAREQQDGQRPLGVAWYQTATRLPRCIAASTSRGVQTAAARPKSR